MSGAKSDIKCEENKPLTGKLLKQNSKIEDEPNSLDSVIRWAANECTTTREKK